MPLYFFNHDNNRETINTYFENLGATRVWAVGGALEICTANDLLFVHAREQRDNWCALGASGIYVIFMSTDVNSLQNLGLNEHVHNCEYPADRLSDHTQINEFINEFPNNPRWDLLKRQLFPETLIAAYLLMVAKDKGINVQLIKEQTDGHEQGGLTIGQWDKAYVQFQGLGKQVQNSCGYTYTDWTNISTWNLDQIKTVKENIDHLFSLVALSHAK